MNWVWDGVELGWSRVGRLGLGLSRVLHAKLATFVALARPARASWKNSRLLSMKSRCVAFGGSNVRSWLIKETVVGQFCEDVVRIARLPSAIVVSAMRLL
jgi:hypothetical protein